ncbi:MULTISPECIES: hypothetical protein [unclassified Burkholderia]|uniref:hypothetical protein n=1 Tax=unclassified Burkholderia TaxID=2613784 RepID=UPI00117CB740|nr:MULTISPECIES: hypothetical protein [unclassified Burkholderia]NIE58869.1 hypothetical protein [Burkholderia sp. Ap-955]NIF11311.1 hypothetical protein [Burkholderia sp. Ax-1735]NIG03705.1 hypothetical protein [Burkholderia sp. Tr-849]
MTLEQRFVPERVHVHRTLEGRTTATIDGKPTPASATSTFSPRGDSAFPVLPVTGWHYSRPFNGREPAIDGMKAACGATPIASRSSATFNDVGSGKATDGR